MSAHHDSLFTAGQWRAPSSGQTSTVISANTKQVIGSVLEAQRADVGPGYVWSFTQGHRLVLRRYSPPSALPPKVRWASTSSS